MVSYDCTSSNLRKMFLIVLKKNISERENLPNDTQKVLFFLIPILTRFHRYFFLLIRLRVKSEIMNDWHTSSPMHA